MQLTKRQKKIAEIVKNEQPITGEKIARKLQVTRSALRGDLAVLLSGEILTARRHLGYYYVGGGEDPVQEKISRLMIRDYMSEPVVVSSDSDVDSAIYRLFTEDTGTLFVGSKENIIGIVSRKDLIKSAMGRDDLSKMPISMVMTPRSKMIYAKPEDTVLTAAEKLLKFEVDCLPVGHMLTDPESGEERFEVEGRVSKTNIVRIFVCLGDKKTNHEA
ncbi:CBS domain-containing protein [Pseudoramibacter sp.]|jgi:CBS domain-containing protein|uniref:CBS domain-containing protein n=1 Tax=Pseudoramibacter sp. TaxID=2034862 RepID=UPI0025D813A2|nr:CBS domain-containing protein [Pseudoramibacter sp.]MCH4072231.1 CBS domain-containing protein [Pseudoramibacter sp.]MCH4106001.1 CBS domain-containing protein [Pseudoramibacter sp.]